MPLVAPAAHPPAASPSADAACLNCGLLVTVLNVELTCEPKLLNAEPIDEPNDDSGDEEAAALTAPPTTKSRWLIVSMIAARSAAAVPRVASRKRTICTWRIDLRSWARWPST